ncbi:SusC/RagA family TonB-linked outer membrane protein [Pedobacter sp. KBW01]|uniref:SusC/RagA family TonB-linked outer membrane protein n=1 Tax=Pedobacter sp. KBW01 TaxID=2153364 RepID=UPI000F5B5B33|nr:SusC/RagA family TonB-linked outer membrane protein [Pedobacter sp. KBW01]RQO77984.1 SusC/RagA family TonB-linked outer membrane protein [Pedobacter sp. KBW01]
MQKKLLLKLSVVFLLLLKLIPVRASVVDAKHALGFKQHIDTLQTGSSLYLVDENQFPIAGLKLLNTKTKKTAITDNNGIAELSYDAGDVIAVYVQQSLVLKTEMSKDRNVIMVSSKNPGVAALRPVRTLFDQTVKSTLSTMATDVVYGSDLTKSPVTSVKAAITGRLSGMFTNQNSGRLGSEGRTDGTAALISLGSLGSDAVTMSLRGQNPVVIVDGIPRPLTIFNMEEIESVTVLKDAVSTAMLGVKGASGAILITTRRGTKAKQTISFTAQTAFLKSLKVPRGLNAFQYATLNNEARVNDGLAPAYTAADLQAYQNGSDPQGHPDVNWNDLVTKPTSRFNHYTLNVAGGNDFGKYFVAVEHINQNGLFRTSDINTYDTDNTFKSYVIRSNVDLQINKKLSGGINLMGRLINSNDPGYGSQAILNSIYATPANAYPIFNPNGSYATTLSYQNNIYAQSVGSGYIGTYKRDVSADLFLKRTFDEITKGLWLKTKASIYATLSENTYRNKSFASFFYNPTTKVYTQYGTIGTQNNYTGINYQGHSDYEELSLGYDRNFDKHGVSAVVLANHDNSFTGSDLPYTVQGISGKASYNYDEKYVAELAFGYNGSNYYPPAGDYKYGFFPAVALAWNINKENFLKDSKWLNTLKLYGSYGKTGNDNPGYFVYIQRYFDGTSTYFGSTPGSNTSIFEQVLANPNITWEKANKFNLGLQGTILDNKLGFTVEYYRDKYYDLLMQRGKNSALIGQSYPLENIGQSRYTGWDFKLNFQQSLNDFSYYIAATGGLQQSKVLYQNEVNQPYPWMARTGQAVGQRFGYIAEGLFQNTSEIAGSAKLEGYTAQPGDIKYRDLNGDGIINQLDQTVIGNTKPLFYYGLNLGFQFKGFDFSALLQGALNRTIYLSNNTEWAFQNNGFGQAWEHNLDRWTPQTAATATMPRLSIGTNINNEATSTFWQHSGNYLRLKNIEVGYTIPNSLTKRIGLQSIRVFGNATNLLTFAAYDRVDPEVYNGNYPIQRSINMGINIKF